MYKQMALEMDQDCLEYLKKNTARSKAFQMEAKLETMSKKKRKQPVKELSDDESVKAQLLIPSRAEMSFTFAAPNAVHYNAASVKQVLADTCTRNVLSELQKIITG